MTIVVIDFMLENSSNKRRMILLDCPTQHITIQSRASSGNMGCHIDIFQYDSLYISFVYYIKLREIRNITQTPMSRHWILDIYRIILVRDNSLVWSTYNLITFSSLRLRSAAKVIR